MANALGKLFGDIANAIRSKTGEEGAMKPAQFPEKIESIESGSDEYNLNLAYGMMIRNARPISGDETTLILNKFQTPDGATLGGLNSYSFAGFSKLEYLSLSNVSLVYPNALLDNSKLKLIDITAPAELPVAGFMSGALNGCIALESVIFRDGGAGISSAMFAAGSTNGANDTFYVYVPAEYYDTVVADVDADTTAAVPSWRYRKLEDYPNVNNWNEKYTVRFWDGDTLLNTETVRCGQSSTYQTTKEGYYLMQWNPAPTQVVADMDCYAEWVPDTLNAASWEQISTMASAGTLQKFYNIGDEKQVEINHSDGTSETVTMVLEMFEGKPLEGWNSINKNGPIAGATFLSKNALSSKRIWYNSYDGSVYNSSALKTWLVGDLYNALPTELQTVIQPTYWLLTPGYKLWVPCAEEMNITYSNSKISAEYYYPAFTRYTSDAKRIKMLGNTGEAVAYWLKNTYESNYDYFPLTISTTGSCYTGTTSSGYQKANVAAGVVFGFCIGKIDT